jgi:hypothetical protein
MIFMAKIVFHAFTDKKDEYLNTYKDAKEVLETWKKEGYENLRLWTMEDNGPGSDPIDLDCLIQIGDFPM